MLYLFRRDVAKKNEVDLKKRHRLELKQNQSYQPDQIRRIFQIFRADYWFFLGEVRNPFLFYLKKKGVPVGQLISHLLYNVILLGEFRCSEFENGLFWRQI